MPEIVLLILKITGMILGAVLGILIAAVCVVLFVPVRYRGEAFIANREEGEGKDFGAVFFASWLLRLVRVHVSGEKAFRVWVRILFFTLYDTAGEEKPEKEKHKSENKSEQIKTAASNAVSEAAEIKESVGQAERKEEPDMPETIESEEDFIKEDKKADSGEEYPRKELKKEKKSIKSRISNILQTIKNFCGKLVKIKEKTEKLKAKAERLKELWEAGHVVRARGLAGRQLLYLLKHTKPRKLEGHLRFGFDDPSTTGYAMAGYGILYPIWSPKLSVEPDFEKELLDCRVIIKGKVRVWHLLKAALILFFSKDVRRTVKDVRKELKV